MHLFRAPILALDYRLSDAVRRSLSAVSVCSVMFCSVLVGQTNIKPPEIQQLRQPAIGRFSGEWSFLKEVARTPRPVIDTLLASISVAE